MFNTSLNFLSLSNSMKLNLDYLRKKKKTKSLRNTILPLLNLIKEVWQVSNYKRVEKKTGILEFGNLFDFIFSFFSPLLLSHSVTYSPIFLINHFFFIFPPNFSFPPPQLPILLIIPFFSLILLHHLSEFCLRFLL